MNGDDLKDLPLPVGSMLYKYQLKSVIGRGGYAWVYQGHDTFIGRDVAIKILHREGGVTDDMLRRGQTEAKLLSRLRHPNIVEIYDAGVSEQRLLYIIMELLVGRSLLSCLRAHTRLTLAEGLPLFIAVADAFETAHGQGAIHRDIKPENIFIIQGNHAKVLDFGIAKITDGGAPMTTNRDMMIGTLLYMSPEQAQGQKLTVRCDIYALGLLMYEAFCGTHPLLINCPDVSMRALVCKQLTEIPPSLDSVAKDIPRELSRIVDRCVSKKASERYASMAELAKALRSCWARVQRELGGDAAPPRDLAGLDGMGVQDAGFAPVNSDKRVLLSRSALALTAEVALDIPSEARPTTPFPIAETLRGPGPQVDGAEAIDTQPQPFISELVGPEAPDAMPQEATPKASSAQSPQPGTPALLPVSSSLPLRLVRDGFARARNSSDLVWWSSLLGGAMLGMVVLGGGTHWVLKRAATNTHAVAPAVPQPVAASVSPVVSTPIVPPAPAEGVVVPAISAASAAPDAPKPVAVAPRAPASVKRSNKTATASIDQPLFKPKREPDSLDMFLKEYEREKRARPKSKSSSYPK